MRSDQELFAKGLATYRKVEAANYMAHREVYAALHDVLMREARSGFTFADLGCGTATGSSKALAGAPIGRYVGVDISEPSLEVARDALASLPCAVEFIHGDFSEVIADWRGALDVVWIGQSLHHLQTQEKRAFMRRVADLLPPGGLLMIWEPTCEENHDREDWLRRFHAIRPQWADVSDEEFQSFETHCRASDYPETASAWKQIAAEAGFSEIDELLIVPNKLARVYRFRR